MGTASANLETLRKFVAAAAAIRGDVKANIDGGATSTGSAARSLRASYDEFQSSGSSAVGNYDLMEVELPGLLTIYQNDETFVAIVRQAFVDADAVTGSDGVARVDASAFSAAFDAEATRRGFDPAALLADRPAVTVDVPFAAGTPQTSGFVADPVCTATGHFVEVEDDFTWPERLDLLRWRRTYSSRFVAEGPFGRGWASWASVGLVSGDDGSVGYQGPDGQMAVFVPSPAIDEPGGYGRVPGIAARLSRVATPEGGWGLVWDPSSARPGAIWTFGPDGLVGAVSDPATGTVTFEHDDGRLASVAHEGGRRLELDWDGGRVVAVRSSCGRVARYRYDDAGDMVGTERVLGSRRYETDDAGRIVEVWDADGVRLCHNRYDAEGRVLAQVSSFGRELLLRYLPGNRTVVSDTEDGPVNIFEHDTVGRLVGLVDDQGHHLRRSFDAEGRCIEATGFDGAVSRQEFTPDGRGASRVGPDGVGERWQYDDHGRVTDHEVEGGARLHFDYEGDGPFPSAISGPDGWRMQVDMAGGLLRSLTDADGVRVELGHDADGNIVATTNGVGATTTTVPHVSGLASRVTLPDGAVYEVGRDDAGRMLTLRSPLGDEYTIEWTPAGRLAGMVDPAGGHTTFEHGAHGAMARVVDALGAELELSHDHLERLVGMAAPGGAKWQFSYSGTGMLSLVHDPAGGTWGYDYDAEGRMVAATDPLGHQVRRRYDRAGRLTEVVDPTGNATRFTRDALGRVVGEDGPEGAGTTFEWDSWGRPTRVRLPDGDTLAYTYTPAGRVRSVTTAEGRGWTSEYDAAGRLVAVTDAGGATTRFGWDDCDRLVTTTSPAGRVETRAYDAGGRVAAVTRGGASSRFAYDFAGRVTAVTDPSGATTRYRYDLRGKLVSATDPRGNTVRVRYDERGNAVAVLDAFGGLTTTTYDAMRRAVATTDQLGRTTRLARDAAGRVVRRELPTGDTVEWRRDARGLATDVRVNGRDTVVFDRDRAGRPVLIHEPARNRTITLGWTRGGRLASLDVDGANMQWDRDGDGLIISRRDPAGRVTGYSWDAAGRLAAESSSRWGRVDLDRDPDGRLVALRGDGIVREWDRDARGLVTAYRETSATGAVGTTTLARDAAGRVTEARTGHSVTRYRYDEAGQLVGAVTPLGGWAWTYDEAGRLVTEDGPDGTTTYRYDEAHQLVEVAGPAGVTGFSYDAAGRRTRESGPRGDRRYSWDGLGRLTGVEAGGRRRDVDVDALGRLAAYDGTPFAWDSAGVLPELVAVGEREVVTAAGRQVGAAAPDGTVEWWAADWQGSVGDPAARDPWGASPAGAALSTSPSPGFLGEVELEGLTWLRNRMYDPATRAFLSPDPLPGVAGLPVVANPYHYANNDPVGFVDPLGLQPLSIDQYNQIREQETGMQWGNIAMGALMVGSFFIPGGPIIATLVGAGMGMAPGIIQGVTTGNWDAGAIIKGGIVGGITGRVGFAFGGASSTLTGAMLRGGAGGATTGLLGQGYDMLPLPGSDGQFNLEDVALDTVIGAGTGGMGHRLSSGDVPTAPRPDYVDLASPQRRTHILDGDATGGGHRWPGLPGKTPFPQSWSDDQIMHNVSDIVTDPSLDWKWTKGAQGSDFTNAGDPSRAVVTGNRDGIDIKVVVEPAGEGIVTAHPVT